jgi:hypothetical protein
MARIIETITHVDELKPACKTAAEMENICCEPTGALQCCVEGDPVWDGYSQDEILEHLGIVLDDDGRDAQGRFVNIEMAPRVHPCGEKRLTYDLSGQNCCDQVDPLVVDEENSAAVVADMSAAFISVTGGRAPFLVSVRGSGFFLDQARTVKDGYVESRSIRVFTGNACGPARVRVSDGCSAVYGDLRSVNGRWSEIINQFEPPEGRYALAVSSGLWPCSFFDTPLSKSFRSTWGRYSLSPTGEDTMVFHFLHESSIHGLWGGPGYTVSHTDQRYPHVEVPIFYSFFVGSCFGAGETTDPSPVYYNLNGIYSLYEFIC